MPVMEEYLTVEEVAQKLKFHPDTVARLLREEKLPGFKIEGSWRVSPTELEAWMKEQREKRSKKKP